MSSGFAIWTFVPCQLGEKQIKNKYYKDMDSKNFKDYHEELHFKSHLLSLTVSLYKIADIINLPLFSITFYPIAGVQHSFYKNQNIKESNEQLT